MTRCRIATRKSPLALWQANWVAAHLQTAHPSLQITLVPCSTRADRYIDQPLYDIGGKGMFVKELEYALLNDEADIAVHSVKDMPVNLPDALVMPVYCQRGNVQDALITRDGTTWADLPAGSRIGTSSLRRHSQLQALRQDIDIVPMRGNVQSRLDKLKRGDCDALILAAAGLERLDLAEHISHTFSTNDLLPAVGQGTIGIECREADNTTQALIAELNHVPTQQCVRAERHVNRRLGGHCMVPIAVHAEIDQEILSIRGRIGTLDGKTVGAAETSGIADQAISLAETLATALINQGAQEIIERYRKD